MATFFKGAFYDEVNNTLEATWLTELFDTQNALIGYQQSRCTNYSAPQKTQFLADVGAAGQKYVTMAGW